MPDDQIRTTPPRSFAWFYLSDELERARVEVAHAQVRAAVYWGSCEAVGDAITARQRVMRLEKELADA